MADASKAQEKPEEVKTDAAAETTPTEAKPATEEKTEAAAEKTETTEAKTDDKPKAEEEKADAEKADGEKADGEKVEETKTEDGEKPKEAEKPREPRMNGSSRKRFIWLTAQGYSKEEATTLAMDALKVAELRAKVNGTPVPQNLKRKPGQAGGGPAAKQQKQEKIIVAVAHPDYPATKTTSDQAGKIKAAILKKVLELKGTDVKPNFEECIFIKDYLRVTCSDDNTFRWLQDIIGTLELWEGASLNVTSEKKLLNIGIYCGTFEDSKGDTTEQIFSFIQSQNSDIDTSKWKLVTRKNLPGGSTVKLSFTLDQPSIRPLKEVAYLVKYKFGNVQIQKIDRTTGKLFIPIRKLNEVSKPSGPGSRNQGQNRFQNVWSSGGRNSNSNSNSSKFSPQSRGRQFSGIRSGNDSRGNSGNFRNRSGPNPGAFRSNANPFESLFEQFNRLNNLAVAARNGGGGGGNFNGSSGGNNFSSDNGGGNNGNSGSFNRGSGGGGSFSRGRNSDGGSGFNNGNRGGNPSRNNPSAVSFGRRNNSGFNRNFKKSKPF